MFGSVQIKSYLTLKERIDDRSLAAVVEEGREGIKELVFYVSTERVAQLAVSELNSIDWLCANYHSSDKSFDELKRAEVKKFPGELMV